MSVAGNNYQFEKTKPPGPDFSKVRKLDVTRVLLLDLGLTAVVVTSKRYWISNPSSFFGKRLSKCQGGKLETKRSFYDVLFIIPHLLDKF